MANKQTFYPVIATRTEGTSSVTFTGKEAVGKMVQVSLTPNTSDVKLYADDDIAEREISFTDASISLNVSTVPATVAAKIFGATYSTTDSSIKYGSINAPYVGFGFCRADVVDGVTTYKAVWLPKCKFSLPSETYDTKGESVTFATYTLAGSAQLETIGSNLNWKEEYSFSTAASAKAKIDELASSGSAAE